MQRGNRGQVLVILAISIFALLGMVALAVDLGYLWSVRHELQRCADAGALAGASRFIPPDTGAWDEQLVKDEAEARARDFASRDLVASATLKPLAQDNEIIVTFDAGIDRIKVRTQRVVPLFFARVFGRQSQLVFAEAVAEARQVTKNVRCIVPWGIPLPWEDVGTGEPNGDFDSDDILHPDRPTAEQCDTYGAIADYDRARYLAGTLVLSDRDEYLCDGSLRILKPGKPSDTLESGHFFGLDFSGIVENCPPEVTINSGANFYEYMIKHPCACDTKISLSDPLPIIDLKPGDMVGPTIQAVAPEAEGGDGLPDPSLIAGDPTGFWDKTTNTPNSLDNDYAGSNWQNSPRVVKVPMYDPTVPPEGGKSQISVPRFEGFWIQDIIPNPDGQGTVIGRFVTLSATGEDGGSEGSSLKILRLVR